MILAAAWDWRISSSIERSGRLAWWQLLEADLAPRGAHTLGGSLGASAGPRLKDQCRRRRGFAIITAAATNTNAPTVTDTGFAAAQFAPWRRDLAVRAFADCQATAA